MRLLSLMVFVFSALFTNAQVKLHNISINADFGNQFQTLLDSEDGTAFSIGSEHTINDVFSIETMYTHDIDGYRAFSRDYGIGAADASPYTRWSNRYREGYVGLRIYPVENYHSQALSLRNKKNYGWYFSIGYGAYMYERSNVNFEHHQSAVYNPDLDQIVYSIDSVFIHRHGYNITNRGTQFGFGWKQYHNKFYYSELGVVTSAYVRENRTTEFWKEEDPDRNQADPYFDPTFWDNYTDHIAFFSKNGRGFVLRFLLGVNLDFRR